MQIIVAHPDTQHSVHAARGLKQARLLKYLFTSVSLRRPPWLDGLVHGIAPAVHERLVQHRAHAGLEPSELRVFPLHFVASRMGDRAWALSQRCFGWQAGRLGVQEGCGVMAFDTNALETFHLLKKAALPCILDQSIAHRRWSNRVGQAECDAHPEWGDIWAAPSWRLEQEDEEVALADIVLCGSAFCAETVVQSGIAREKVAVVEYGADTSRFRPRSEPVDRTGPVRLLFVGALALRKGIHHLLQATQRLVPLGVRLSAVGASRVRAEALARYADFLERPGFRLHADMPRLYADHDIFVLPSLVEGSSLAIYEAMASGLPVVTTPNAGSIVRDGVDGLIVPGGDVDALTSALERLVRDRELRLTMGRNARERACTYGDWSHYGERLSSTLTRFLERWGSRT
jgi:glycosyltransferase involved in cell wall biosynthesis